jgi:hypothetical protein
MICDALYSTSHGLIYSVAKRYQAWRHGTFRSGAHWHQFSFREALRCERA